MNSIHKLASTLGHTGNRCIIKQSAELLVEEMELVMFNLLSGAYDQDA